MSGNKQMYFAADDDHAAWLDQVREDILDTDLPIIDAHHHLWQREPPPYLFHEFLADVSTGHNVVASVYAECHSMYRATGPEEMIQRAASVVSDTAGGVAANATDTATAKMQVRRNRFTSRHCRLRARFGNHRP